MQDLSPFPYRDQASGARVSLCGRLGLIALLLLCSASALFGLTGESGPQPLYVGKITFDQRNVFEESDSSFLRVVGSVANTVHALTDEDVIRRELLFKEGDLYDPQLVEESGQNLRRIGIVGDVVIVTDTLPNNSVHITVRTRDRWTLRPGVSLQQEGERQGFAVAVRDENFLGNAQKLRLGYRYLSGPGNPHGGEIAFTEPRLWGSRWSMTMQYAVSQESRLGAFIVECPFYSHRDPWAAHVSADLYRYKFLEFRDGEAIDRGYFSQENEVAWVASSVPGSSALGVAAAYMRMRTRALTFQPRPFENVDFVIGSVSLLGRKYVTVSSSEFAGRVEDVPLGYQAGLAFGRNLHFIASGTVDYFGKIYGQTSAALTENVFASYQAMVTTYFDRWVPRESNVSGIVLHHWKMSQNQNLTGRVAAVVGSRLHPYSQLVLGASTGLRGYRNYEFFGQRILLLNLEHRILSLVRIWFLRLGGVLFFDSGAICNQDESLQRQRFHSSAGFGLRANVGTGIFRLDVAYNLDQRRVSFAFSANQLFRVFSPLEFLSPVPEQPLR